MGECGWWDGNGEGVGEGASNPVDRSGHKVGRSCNRRSTLSGTLCESCRPSALASRSGDNLSMDAAAAAAAGPCGDAEVCRGRIGLAW